MAFRASVSPHADSPSVSGELGPLTSASTEATQTEPASHWDNLVGFHAQAHLAITPGNARIFKASSCLDSRPMLKGACLWGTPQGEQGNKSCVS